jgi:hypothetical protein
VKGSFMKDDVFESVSDIDAALDKEFGEVANEPETETTEVEVENASSEETIVSDENTEEEESKEELPEQNPQGTNEGEEPAQVEEDKNESKKDHAFANLRSENSNLKKERDGYKADSDYLKELAASYGYTDVSKFQDAVREARLQKEAQEKGYDYSLYKETMDQKARIAELEKQREDDLRGRRLERFRNALDEAVKTYNVDEQEIFSRLENSGIAVEDLLAINNPKLILDGVLVDEIKNSAKQSQIQDLQNMKGLVEDKNEQAGTAQAVTIDSLLKADLANYKKENFFE